MMTEIYSTFKKKPVLKLIIPKAEASLYIMIEINHLFCNRVIPLNVWLNDLLVHFAQDILTFRTRSLIVLSKLFSRFPDNVSWINTSFNQYNSHPPKNNRIR